MVEDIVTELGLNEGDAIFDNTGKMEFYLDGDNQFAKIYSKLDADSEFWEEETQSYINQFIAKYVFTDGEFYEITITADFVGDKYMCVI